jgi:hypothetical protein
MSRTGTLAPMSNRPSVSPLAGAVSMALAAFVSFMSVVVAIVAFAVAGRQSDHPGAVLSDTSAQLLSYVVAMLLLVDGYWIIRHGRLRPRTTATCTTVFVLATTLTMSLFLRAWW